MFVYTNIGRIRIRLSVHGNVLFISEVGAPGPSWLVPPDPPVTVPGLREGPEAEPGRGHLSGPNFNGKAGRQSPLQCPGLCN